MKSPAIHRRDVASIAVRAVVACATGIALAIVAPTFVAALGGSIVVADALVHAALAP